MKETVQAFAPQPVITEDNVTIGIDTVVYYQVTDAVKARYEVANVLQAMEQLTITTLRNVVGAMTLEETLTSRDSINSQLRSVLDEATEKWGVRVTRVELEVDRPAADDPGGDGAADAGRPGQAGGRAPGRGREAVGDPARGGPARRRRS